MLMKKLLFTVIALMITAGASAQYLNEPEKVFNQGKAYIGAGLSGFDLNYNQENKFKLDFNIRGGYMIANDWMLLADIQTTFRKNAPNYARLGVGGRFYIEQNGLFVGLNAHYLHANYSYDDFIPSLNVGYAFFVSRTVTIEPELYYNQSFKSHSEYSGLGLRVGIGIYLDKLIKL